MNDFKGFTLGPTIEELESATAQATARMEAIKARHEARIRRETDLLRQRAKLAEALRALLPPDSEPGTGEWWGLSEKERHDRIRTALANLDK